MKTIEEMLRNLGRTEVLEFGLVSNRLPSVNVGGKFEPVDNKAPTTDMVLQMLVQMGGSRYVESLSAKPTQWTTRLDGVGVIAIAAIMRDDIVQARFTVARREAAGQAAPAAAPARPSVAAQPTAASALAHAPTQAMPAVQPSQPQKAPPQIQKVQPAAAKTATQPVRVQPSQAPPAAAPAPAPAPAPARTPSSQSVIPSEPRRVLPSESTETGVIARAPASAGPLPARSAPAADGGALPAASEPLPWDDDDDDEPTVQTFSPGGPTPELPADGVPSDAEPRPKPARTQADATASLAPKAPAPAPPAEERSPDSVTRNNVTSPAAASVRSPGGPRRIPTPTSPDALDAARRPSPAGVAKDAAAAPDAAAEKAAQEAAARAAAEKAAQEAAARAAAEAQARPASPPSQPMHSITASMASSIAVTQEDPPVEGPVTPAKSEAEVHDPTLDVRAPELRGQIEVLPADTEEPSRVERAVILSVPPPPAEELSIIEPYLAMALANGASDILLVPGRSPLLRVASDLLPKGPAIAPAQMAQLVSAVVPSRLVARLERDGHCNFSIAHAVHGRFRAHVSRQRSGVKITLRAVPREVPTLSSLGLPDTLAHVARMHSGLVLVTGPAGHGKSCTVAALVDLLNGGTHGHIVTIEDPMEHVHSRKRALVSQREVGIHTKSVATGLAAALREDPSVIVVGELTSAEVIRAALAAAESGYLVLATLAATGVARAIDRIIDTFPAGEQSHVRSVLAGVLRLSMGQRLVPSSDRTRLHVAVELLPASVALYSLVRDGKTAQIPGLMQRGKALGIVRLDESLAELARTSKVTLDTAKQYAEVPAELEASVRGKRDEAGKSLAPRK